MQIFLNPAKIESNSGKGAVLTQMNNNNQSTSPYWGMTTKLVIGLTLVAIAGALLIRFQNLIGPLILSFILSFILHPLASRVVNRTRLSWRMAVNLIFILLILVIALTATATSVAVINQLESLIWIIQRFFAEVPEIITDLSTNSTVYEIPIINYQFSYSQLFSQLNIDLLSVTEQVLGVVQPVLGQAGGLLGTLATSAVTGVGWGFFILLVSYFILSESSQVPDFFKNLDLPGHLDDFRRLANQLAYIWSTFLRGQLLIVFLIFVAFLILMSLLGVRYAFGLAMLAGLAKFVPYIGPFIASVATAIVAFLQDGNYFGMSPFAYAIMILVARMVLDQIFDSLIIPRIFGQSLGVHPAALLVIALVAANLLGVVGLLLAAPVLATAQLFTRYVFRKMVDLDPWPETDPEPIEIQWPFVPEIKRVWNNFKTRISKRKNNDKSSS